MGNSTALTAKEISTAITDWVVKNRPGVLTTGRANTQLTAHYIDGKPSMYAIVSEVPDDWVDSGVNGVYVPPHAHQQEVPSTYPIVPDDLG
jgi:hypothetical protein